MGGMRVAGLPVALAVAMGGSAVPAAEAATGSIRGRVEVTREAPAPGARPSVGELAMPSPRDVPNRRRSVVYLDAAPQGAFEEHARARAVMDQHNETFVPYVLAVAVGTTVDFTNSDRTYHNVFSLSRVRRFDLGRYAGGESKSVRFDRPGVVRVFCEIHSHMSAFILVFAHRFFATTDSDGRYRIDNIPPGTYTIVAWNDGETRETRTVHIPEDGGTVEQDFVVR
jgi:plastocyanin